MTDPNLLAGLERAEDAGVYRLSDEVALVQTVDFFTPIVDDPYTFGQIAVANSLSDVYAKGARPLTAMNIVCFPVKAMDMSVLHEILAGGIDKMREAGVLLVGGHSVDDPELKYGLSVTGLVHPEKVVFNTGARLGDRLVLTKALGTGIVSTAVKADMTPQSAVGRSVKSMLTLNRAASELMLEAGPHACTDITGFGLLGHACEMIEGTDVGLVIHASSVPVFPEVRELAEGGLLPGGLHRNREYRRHMVDMAPGVPDWLADVLYDPQTSGGLLIAVPESAAVPLVERMHAAGAEAAAVIGEVSGGVRGRVVVEP